MMEVELASLATPLAAVEEPTIAVEAAVPTGTDLETAPETPEPTTTGVSSIPSPASPTDTDAPVSGDGSDDTAASPAPSANSGAASPAMSDEPTQEEETLSPSAEAIATDDELTREDVVVADEIAAGAVDETVVPTETAELKLMSPAGEAHADEIYYWPLTVLANGFDPGAEMINTILLISAEKEFEEHFAKNAAFVRAADNLNRKNLASLQILVEEYNNTIEEYRKTHTDAGKEIPQFPIGSALLTHTMSMIYGRAIGDPTKLNRYKGWSEEVYGEFSSNLISQIVQEVPIKAEDNFIDLGSGVGQVVLQVASEALCKDAWGVEKQRHPAEYADVMKVNYERVMNWFGKKHGPYDVLQGDFMEEQWRSKITEADVVFVNNYAFGTELNQRLAERFKECKPGARIVSSRNFAPLSFTITDRTLGDLGCILKVRRVTCKGEGVSWTSGPFDYYIQTVDWSMFQAYMDQEGIKRPMRCSTPELEADADIESDPEPDLVAITNVPKKVAKPKKVKADKNDYDDDKQPEYRKRALASVKQPAAKRVKTSSASSHHQASVIRTADQFVAQSSDLVADLIDRCKPKIDSIASELILKTQTMHLYVKDLNREVDDDKTRNALVRKSNGDEAKERFAAVSERSRTSGLNKRHRRGADPHHLRLAIDVATEHEIWQRLRDRLTPEVEELRKREAKLKELKSRVGPTAEALIKVVDFLKLGSAFDWAAAGAPSAASIGSLRKGLTSIVAGGSGSAGSSRDRKMRPPSTSGDSGRAKSSSSGGGGGGGSSGGGERRASSSSSGLAPLAAGAQSLVNRAAARTAGKPDRSGTSASSSGGGGASIDRIEPVDPALIARWRATYFNGETNAKRRFGGLKVGSIGVNSSSGGGGGAAAHQPPPPNRPFDGSGARTGHGGGHPQQQYRQHSSSGSSSNSSGHGGGGSSGQRQPPPPGHRPPSSGPRPPPPA